MGSLETVERPLRLGVAVGDYHMVLVQNVIEPEELVSMQEVRADLLFAVDYFCNGPPPVVLQLGKVVVKIVKCLSGYKDNVSEALV